MRDKFIYTVQLRIPAGYDIPATIENVKRFFSSGGTEGREVVKACLPVNTIIPERFISKEMQAIKERICTALLDPAEWHHKPLNIFVHTEQSGYLFELDENRKPVN